MIAASIPLVKTLLTANHIVSNRILKHRLAKLPDWINAGESLQTSIQKKQISFRYRLFNFFILQKIQRF